MGERKTVEDCGCEFTELWDYETGGSCCFLSKCKCQKHYDEQLVAEWYDHEGHHRVIREPEEVAGLVTLEAV